jgi:polar amino acid transport system ATP-binding protein
VIGRSGSGKSTMLRCINALEPIQGGRITVGDTVVNDPATDLRKLRQQVGIVFQSYNLFPHLSVERNITLAPTVIKKMPQGEARKLAEDVLARVGLSEKIDAYPHEMGFALNVANRVVFMHQGKVWEEGPARETLGRPRTPELESFLGSVLH